MTTRLEALPLLFMLFVLFVLVRVPHAANAAPLLSPILPLRQEQAEEEEVNGDDAEVEEVDDTWRGPLANRNQFPPAFLFISLEPERARVLQKGDRSVFVNFDYSNILVLQESELEDFQIDLETLRILLQGKWGLGREFEVAGSLPIYWMQGGFLDPFISAYHNVFHFPNRIRGREPDNLFRYHWRVEDAPILTREDGFVALGDLTLQVKRAITWKELGATELAARAAIKLPIGSPDSLVSSGGTDLGFGVELSRVGRKVGGFFNLSYHVTSDLDEVRSKNFLSWMAAVDWRFKPRFSAVLQYDQFQPFLESDIKVLSRSGRQIVFGLRWRRSDRFHFEWRFAEDLSVSTATAAPDFTLGLQVTYHWRHLLH